MLVRSLWRWLTHFVWAHVCPQTPTWIATRTEIGQKTPRSVSERLMLLVRWLNVMADRLDPALYRRSVL